MSLVLKSRVGASNDSSGRPQRFCGVSWPIQDHQITSVVTLHPMWEAATEMEVAKVYSEFFTGYMQLRENEIAIAIASPLLNGNFCADIS